LGFCGDGALLEADSFEDLPGKWQAAILKTSGEPATRAVRLATCRDRTAGPELV
jgi:hypothetical protein